MKAYYLGLKKCLSPVETAQSEFPEHRTFTNMAQIVQKLRYTKKLKDHVFHAVMEDGGQSVIVKFVQRYSTEAHFCADNDLAAHLLGTRQVTTCYSMVVMEEVCDAVSLRDYCGDNPTQMKPLQQECEKVLNLLHDNNFCHGDFRDCNILVVPSGRSKSLTLNGLAKSTKINTLSS